MPNMKICQRLRDKSVSFWCYLLNNEHGWMDERFFRPLLCTVKAELGRGQPGLMR